MKDREGRDMQHASTRHICRTFQSQDLTGRNYLEIPGIYGRLIFGFCAFWLLGSSYGKGKEPRVR